MSLNSGVFMWEMWASFLHTLALHLILLLLFILIFLCAVF